MNTRFGRYVAGAMLSVATILPLASAHAQSCGDRLNMCVTQCNSMYSGADATADIMASYLMRKDQAALQAKQNEINMKQQQIRQCEANCNSQAAFCKD